MSSVFPFSEFSLLYEESKRVLLAKTMVLLGLALVIQGICKYPFTVLLAVALIILLVGGIVRVRLNKFFTSALLDTYLCLLGGVNCRDFLVVVASKEEGESPIEKMLFLVLKVMSGKLNAVNLALSQVEKYESPLTIGGYLIVYQLSLPMGLVFLIASILGALNITLTTSLSPVQAGFLLIFLGVILGVVSGRPSKLQDHYTNQIHHEDLVRRLLPSHHERAGSVNVETFLEYIIPVVIRVSTNANPNLLGLNIDLPLIEHNLYEYSPRLRDVINYIEKVFEDGYVIEYVGDDLKRIYDYENSLGNIKREDESPIDIFNNLLCFNKSSMGICSKILIKEGKIKNPRTVALVAISAWKCKSRRIISVVMVGRRDVIFIVKTLMGTYLWQSSNESVFCGDDHQG